MVDQADRADLVGPVDLEDLVGMKEADMVDLLVGTSGKVVGMTTETQSDRAIEDISPTHPHCCSPLMHRLTWQIIVFPILCVCYLLWPDLVGAFFSLLSTLTRHVSALSIPFSRFTSSYGSATILLLFSI